MTASRNGGSGQWTTASPFSTGGESTVRVRRLVLVYAPQTSASTIATLTREPVEIGREPRGPHALTIPDTEVSRVHAAAEYDDGDDAWSIVDRGSRNGIYVDGVKASRARLVDGSV